MKRLLVAFAFLLASIGYANAQAGVALYCWSPTGTGLSQWQPCNSTNPLQVAGTVSATVTFPTIGSAVPTTGIYDALNVAGTLRGWTGVNPSGSIYAGQVDLASVGGASVGTAGSAGTGVVTVQGIAAMTPVLVTPSAPADPCFASAKTNLPISTNSNSSVQLIALSGGTTIYVCSLSLIAAGATTVAVTTGTGTACVTNNAAVVGTTTASIANSMSLAANGGLTLGSGVGTIAKGAAASELCMILGSSVYVSGNLTYVQQ
jgi:hypothetical protein